MCFAAVQSKIGAHDQDRTDDLILTKDVLYQLSYMGNSSLPTRIISKTTKKPANPNFFRITGWDYRFFTVSRPNIGTEYKRRPWRVNGFL